MPPRETHISAWIAFSSVSFCAVVTMAALGLVYLPLNLWMRGCLAVAALCLVHASASLTETLRNRHEAEVAR